MRSIERKYKKIKNKNQGLGAYPCLALSVKHKRFSRKSILKAFNELVPEDEYSVDETKGLVDYLDYLTNLPEEGEIRPKNRF